jgi:phage-related protein
VSRNADLSRKGSHRGAFRHVLDDPVAIGRAISGGAASWIVSIHHLHKKALVIGIIFDTNNGMSTPRKVTFIGSSREDMQDFPADAKADLGKQLWAVQNDKEPKDWKPMPSIGPGVRELRTQEASGAFRVVYVARIAGKVHVLHAFQKKTQQTAQKDIDLAKRRLREAI